jgi:hypothetical protein
MIQLKGDILKISTSRLFFPQEKNRKMERRSTRSAKISSYLVQNSSKSASKEDISNDSKSKKRPREEEDVVEEIELEDENKLSAYEKERLENIKKNQEMLVTLGLSSPIVKRSYYSLIFQIAGNFKRTVGPTPKKRKIKKETDIGKSSQFSLLLFSFTSQTIFFAK